MLIVLGRTALMLSGGAAFGENHLGLVIELMEHKYLPKVISGSSVGALFASIICCKSDKYIYEYILDPTSDNYQSLKPLREKDFDSWFGAFIDIIMLV